jgi:hypothetical protein
MLYLEHPPIANSTGINGTAMPSGLDLITTIQILLVQDYDNQLRGIQKQMKGAIAVKKQYRQDIEALQKLLTKQSKKIDDKFYIPLESHEEIMAFRKEGEYAPNLKENPGEKERLYLDRSQIMPYEEFKKSVKFKDGKTYVEKSQIENKIEVINQRLERVNEQSELTSLNLQSLTNQRKIALETVSNLIRKDNDTLETIIRNINR